MVSLKREPKKEEGGEEGCSPCWDHDTYPVRMHISNEEFEKLEMGSRSIGEEYELKIKVRVTSLSKNESYDEDGETKSRSSAELVVMEAEPAAKASSDSERALRMYKG